MLSSVSASLHPIDLAGELVAGTGVVVTDGHSGVAAEVAGLVTGVDHRDGGLDAALADLPVVDVERDEAALGQAAAVMGELHPDLVVAGRDGGFASTRGVMLRCRGGGTA